MEYGVIIEHFTERHFIKSFEKKYKNAWYKTREIIIEEFEQIDILFLKNAAETIIDSDEIKICKTEFKIAGTNESRKGSGNRCIVAVHKNTNMVRVILVYTKNDIQGHNETNWWKGVIRDNYPDYSDLV